MGTYSLRVSPHFILSEFVCKCGGYYQNCDRAWVHAALPAALEIYRAKFSPEGLTVISGYRCVDYNQKVGGAPLSQHRFGTAADIAGKAKLIAVKSLNLFSGLGVNRISGLVVHVDMRHLGPENTPGSDTKRKASPTNPAIWFY